MQKILTLPLFVLLALFSLVSCNTTIGLARDLRVMGTEIEKKAESTYKGGSSSDNYEGAPVY